MIDRISQEEGILLNTIQSKALIGIGTSSIVLPLFLLISFSYCCLLFFLLPDDLDGYKDYLYDQYRLHWGGTNFAGKTSGIYELQWGIGLSLFFISAVILCVCCIVALISESIK